eukprot:4398632-Pleurochrysis_carterae.AAC.4
MAERDTSAGAGALSPLNAREPSTTEIISNTSADKQQTEVSCMRRAYRVIRPPRAQQGEHRNLMSDERTQVIPTNTMPCNLRA